MDIDAINDNFFAFLDDNDIDKHKKQLLENNIQANKKPIKKKKQKTLINKIETEYNIIEDEYAHLSSEWKKPRQNIHHIPIANPLCIPDYKEPEKVNSPDKVTYLDISLPDILPKPKIIRGSAQYDHKRKQVQTLNGEFIFKSTKEASEYFGLHKSAIAKAIGSKTRCAGYYWRYTEIEVNSILSNPEPNIPILDYSEYQGLDLMPLTIQKDFLLLGKSSFPAILLLSYMYQQSKQVEEKLKYEFIGYPGMTFFIWIGDLFNLYSTVIHSALKYLIEQALIIEIEPLKQPYYLCSYYINTVKISNQIQYNKDNSVKYQVRKKHLQSLTKRQQKKQQDQNNFRKEYYNENN